MLFENLDLVENEENKFFWGKCASNHNHLNGIQELTEVSNIITATEGSRKSIQKVLYCLFKEENDVLFGFNSDQDSGPQTLHF